MNLWRNMNFLQVKLALISNLDRKTLKSQLIRCIQQIQEQKIQICKNSQENARQNQRRQIRGEDQINLAMLLDIEYETNKIVELMNQFQKQRSKCRRPQIIINIIQFKTKINQLQKPTKHKLNNNKIKQNKTNQSQEPPPKQGQQKIKSSKQQQQEHCFLNKLNNNYVAKNYRIINIQKSSDENFDKEAQLDKYLLRQNLIHQLQLFYFRILKQNR